MNKGPSVLVVDDEQVVCESCTRILAKEGFAVEASVDSREGLKMAQTKDYAAMLLDMRMPGLDGLEVARTLRRTRPQLPIIIITGYPSVSSAAEAFNLGIVEYVEKPFTPNQITDVVARVVPAVKETDVPAAEADRIKHIVGLAARDHRFRRRLLDEGSRALDGFNISSQAKAAILSGDVAWIKKKCGDLSAEQCDWLESRLEAETW